MKNKVRYLRRSQEFDITQEQLAEAVGVSRVSIADLERGGSPSGELMLRIAIFFGKDPREIFFTDYVVSTLQDVKRKKKGIAGVG